MTDRKWWLSHELDEDGVKRWVCYKCSGTGVVPFLEIKNSPAGRKVYTKIAECDCMNKKEMMVNDKKFSKPYDEITGGRFQFPYSAVIMCARTPRITYHEVYQVYEQRFRADLAKDKNAPLNKSVDVLREYLKRPIDEPDMQVFNSEDNMTERRYWDD